MDPSVRNLLYRHPEYYERVYPEPDEDTPRMCLRMFDRYLAAPPQSILDVGCGTGRDLDVLSRTRADCWGFDALPEMIECARSRRPHLRLDVGDMRTARLGRTFDAILCMGSVFMYALTNEDVARTLETFAAHAHEGTLLILDINNAAGFLGGGTFRDQTTAAVDVGDFTATTVSRCHFDRPRQLLVRRRTWQIPGRAAVEDYCEYRLHFPGELDHLLAERGFRVAGMFDNKELRDTDLSGARLYVAALKQPARAQGGRADGPE